MGGGLPSETACRAPIRGSTLEAFQRTAGTAADIEFTTANVLDGEWHHVAFTIDGSEQGDGRITLFLDGIDVGTYFAFNSPSGTPGFLDQTFYIGSRTDNQIRFVGLLDEVRISDRILSPSEFLNASAPPVPSLSPLAIALLGTLMGLGGWRKLRAYPFFLDRPPTVPRPTRIGSAKAAVNM